MSDERNIQIVIRAQDEFSGVMEQAASNAEASASRMKKSFDGAIGSTAVEKIYLDYQKKLVALQDYNTAAIQEMTRTGMAQAAIDEKYTEMSVDSARKRRDFQIQAASDTAGAISNTLENLYVATGGQNRALFEAMKAFAIAETTIKTYQGAMEAYSAMAGIPVVGPALGAAAAATVVAAGMARVAQISSTSIGGGSSISASGEGYSSYSGGSYESTAVPIDASSATRTQDITIQIYNPLSTQNWQQIVEDNIIPALNDAADRNINVTVKNV